MSWVRVTKSHSCPVCGKPDWCCIGDFFYNCMRVQSEQPCKNGGWLHPIGNTQKHDIPKPAPRPVINCKRLIEDWSRATKEEWLRSWCTNIGMTTQSLRELNCCWASPHSAWAFPMSDGYGNWVGIRLRSESGQKWAVPGSHQGVFLPRVNSQRVALITEGPTDTCAGLQLGFYTIGRPSCSGGVGELRTALRRNRVSRAVIVCDNDPAGINGAKMLSEHIGVMHCLVVLPAKDLRKFVMLGGTRELLDSMINTSVWKVSA